MKAIKNTLDKDLEMSFGGYIYKFPKGKTYLIEDDLYEHIGEIWGKVFDDVKLLKKKQYMKPKKVKTPSYIQPEPKSTYSGNDMRVTKLGQQGPTYGDGTPKSGTVDKDGVAWYGKGIEIE